MHRTISSALPTALVLGALLSIAGCTTTKATPDKPEAKPAVVDAPKLAPAPARTRTSPFDANLPTPDSIMAVGGVPSLSSLGELASAMSAAANMGSEEMDVESYALEALAGQFGWSDTSWVDLNAPLYLVVPNAAQFPNGKVMVLPISNLGPALEAMPKTAGMDVAGHLRAYRHNGTDVYADVVGRHLVLTNQNNLFAAIAPFARKVITWTPQGVGTAYVVPGTVRKAFEKEIKQAVASIPMLLDLAGNSHLFDLESIARLVLRFFDESALYRFTLKRHTLAKSKHIALEAAVLPAKGSGLAQFMQHMSRSKVPFAGMLPPSTWFGGLMDLDLREVAGFRELSKGQNKVMATRVEKLLGSKAGARATVLADELYKRSTGKSLFALFGDGGWPMAMLTLAGMDGETKANRAAYNEYMALLLPVMWDAFTAALPAGDRKMVQVKKVTLKGLVKLANKPLKKLALKLKLVSKKKGGVFVDAIVLATTKLSSKLANQEELTMIHQVMKGFGGSIQMAVAYGPKLVAAGFGPNGQAQAEKAAAGGGMGGMPRLSSVTPAGGAAVISAFNLGELFEALKRTPVVGSMMGLPTISTNEMAFTSIKTEGAEGVVLMSMPESYMATVGKMMF